MTGMNVVIREVLSKHTTENLKVSLTWMVKTDEWRNEVFKARKIPSKKKKKIK